MPTTLPRVQITETPSVTHALDVAARRWPELTSRSALLAAIAEEGARAVEREMAERAEERRQLVDKYAGGFHFEPGFLEKLREDWPE